MTTIPKIDGTAKLIVLYSKEPQRYGIRGSKRATTYTPVAGKTATCGRNDPCPCGSGRKYKRCCRSVVA